MRRTRDRPLVAVGGARPAADGGIPPCFLPIRVSSPRSACFLPRIGGEPGSDSARHIEVVAFEPVRQATRPTERADARAAREQKEKAVRSRGAPAPGPNKLRSARAPPIHPRVDQGGPSGCFHPGGPTPFGGLLLSAAYSFRADVLARFARMIFARPAFLAACFGLNARTRSRPALAMAR
jgi:hypothetical protein